MERFIVGTGRCGSTLLSRMLAENRSLLMIFEFFSGLDRVKRFVPDPLAGREFADLLSVVTPAATMVQRRGYEIAEITYPYGPDMRYRQGEGLPWVLGTAMARMSDVPDELFDETLAFASELPRRGLASQYESLFDWLCERMGRSRWLEKSGASIEYLASLHEFFPAARFLHLHRRGPEAALSMREHKVFRLWVSLTYGLTDHAGLTSADLESLDPEAEPRPSDVVTRLLEAKPPVECFGRYWTELIEYGYRARDRLDAGQYMEVAFEELVRHPREVLGKINEFFELGDAQDGWIERAAELVRGVPPTRFERLSGQQQERLAEACRPGQQLVGQND